MTDFTIREIRDLRELSDPPVPHPEPIAQDKKAEREAALALSFHRGLLTGWRG
jgi:hypothetical protein